MEDRTGVYWPSVSTRYRTTSISGKIPLSMLSLSLRSLLALTSARWECVRLRGHDVDHPRRDPRAVSMLEGCGKVMMSGLLHASCYIKRCEEAHLDERERGLRWAMTHDMCWGSPQRYRSFLLKERHNRNLSQRPETE